MGVRYEGMKLVWLKQSGGKTTTIAWVSPDEGSLGAFAGGSKVAIPVKVRVINGPKPTFTLADGQLPPGLTFDTATGSISGTPENATGDYSFTLRATSGEATVERAFQIAVATNAAPVWVTPSGSLGSPFDSTDYDYTLEAVDPEGQPVTYSLVTGSLPGGLKLDQTTGEIKGRLRYVNANTTFFFTVRASDGIAATNESFNITVRANEAPFWITAQGNDPVTTFIEGVEHSFAFEAQDPEGNPLTYSVARGELPEGFTFDSSTGVLSGTLGTITTGRTITLTLLVSDGVKGAERAFSIALAKNEPPIWTAPAAPVDEVSGYIATIPLVATDPNGRPVTITFKEGETQPAGFNIIENNLIGPVPEVTEATDLTFKLVASDGVQSAERVVVIRAVPNTAPVWSTDSDLGEAIELRPLSRQLVAIDPEGKPVTYTATTDLPFGVTLSETGLLSGMPSDVEGDTTFEFSVEASDGVFQVERDFSLLVRADVAPQWNTPAGLLGYVYGQEEAEFVLSATDPNGDSVTYSLGGGSLPTGLVFSGNKLSGMIPAYLGDDEVYNFTINATDATGNATPRAFSVILRANQPIVWETAAGRQLEAFESAPVSFTVRATDPEGKEVRYGLPQNGQLPRGFGLNSTTGVITGTVPVLTQDAELIFTIVAFVPGQADSARVSRTFTILGKFNTAPEFVTGSALSIVEQRSSSLKIVARNPGNGPMVYTVVSGALPTGLTLQTNGNISGFAPVAAEDTDYTFTVRANNGIKTTDQEFTITVQHNYAPVWQTEAGSLGTVFGGASSVFTPVATDANNQPIFYSLVSGTLPAGMTLSPSNGRITGAPAIAGTDVTSTFVLGASDGVLRSDREFSITVSANTAPTWTTNAGSLGTVVRNKTFSFSLRATDAELSSLTYTVVSGQLPQGILLNRNTGELVGRAPDVTENETYTFTVRASDGALFTDREFSINVNTDAAPVWATPAGSLGSVLSGYSASFPFSASDPEGLPLTYTLVSGSLPSGWTFSNDNRRIATPEDGSDVQSVDETFNITIRASDGQVFSDRQFSFTVLKNLKPTWNVVYDTTLGSITERTDIDFTVEATDPEAQGITYVVTDGALPSGITLNSETGQVSGKLPFVTEDTDYAFTIKAYDSKVYSDPLNYTLRVLFDSPPIWTTPAGTIGTGLEEADVSYTVAATSNGGEIIYGLKFGSNLPGTLTINDETGVISGRLPLVELPSVDYNFTLTATNGSGKTSERNFRIVVQDNVAPMWQTPGGLLLTDLAGTEFSFTLLATDGNGTPITYSLVDGELPVGVTFDPLTRVLSGVLPEVETDTTYTFTIGASDGNIRTDREFSLRSLKDTAPVWVTNTDLGSPYEQTVFTTTLVANDPQGKTITYSLKEGSTLPGTLTLIGSAIGGQNPIPAGRLSGTLPANEVVGSTDQYTFTVIASDGVFSTERTFTLSVRHNTAPVWTTPGGSLGAVVEGQPYSQQVIATDPEGQTITYSLASGSTLPGGFNLNAQTGVISGTAGTVASTTIYPFTVNASDGLRTTARAFSLTINNAEAPVDTFSNNVVLLMQMNGSYAENTAKPVYPTNKAARTAMWITNQLQNDAGEAPLTIFSGVTANSASQSGNGGLDFTSGGTQNGRTAYVRYDAGLVNDGYLTQIGSNDFTIEAWVRMSPRGTEDQTIFSHVGHAEQGSSPARMSVSCQYRPGVGMIAVIGSTNPATSLTIPGDFADGQWHHVAITRQGNIFRHFVDGVSASGTFTSAVPIEGSLTVSSYLGNIPAFTAGLNGQIDGFRMTIGEALYTAGFTPSPTLSLAGVGPTTTDLNAKTDFGDSLRITAAGQGLTLSHSSDFTVANGDEMTYEAWIRPDDITTTGAVFSKVFSNSLVNISLLKVDSRLRVVYQYVSSPQDITTAPNAVEAGVWTHVAVVISRSGGQTVKIYVNGVEAASGAITNGALRDSAFAPFMIGTDYQQRSFLGHIDEVRFTRAARYTANFTPAAIQTDPIPRINTRALVSGVETYPANYPISATDAAGTGSLTYSQTGLGSGLTLSPTTGVISGTNPDSMFTPNNFTVVVTDAKGNKAQRALSLAPTYLSAPAPLKHSFRFNDSRLDVSTPASLFAPNVGSNLTPTQAPVGMKYATAPGRPGEYALNIQNGYNYAGGVAVQNEIAYINSSDFTIEGWFNTAGVSSGTPTLMALTSAVRFTMTPQGLSITYNGITPADRFVLASNTWHHVAMVRKGASVYVYVNGSLWQTLTAATTAGSDLSFGTASGSSNSSLRFSTPTYLRNWNFYTVAKYEGSSFTPTWRNYLDTIWGTIAVSAGATGQPVSYQITDAYAGAVPPVYTSSDLPNGVTLSPTGLITGTYPAIGSPLSFTVSATDSLGVTKVRAVSIQGSNEVVDTLPTNTTLLLTGRGTTGSALVESKFNRAITFANSNILTVSAGGKWGDGQITFANQSGTIKAVMVDYPPQIASTNNWTMEAWINHAERSNSLFHAVFSNYQSASGGSVIFGINTSGQLYKISGAGDVQYSATGGTVPLNTWTHIAYVRDGGIMKFFINGTQTGTYNWTNNLSQTYPRWTIGSYEPVFGNSINRHFRGAMTDIRFTNVARYTANFTPPAGPLGL